ncbi:hypothetical protein RISW2_19455 [Roseivivax isoporae LMG 25204]|uniref:Uncharacterized protein n=1 Tax=Roseivivax isoporae LMG 25204 TaxID=1449351 RepID=X7F1W4_9RHOB|nr:hypothetical protein RISW2_19455 [Roseivivax isoporae LMG 25204]
MFAVHRVLEPGHGDETEIQFRVADGSGHMAVFRKRGGTALVAAIARTAFDRIRCTRTSSIEMCRPASAI